jgi:hypothetical protein
MTKRKRENDGLCNAREMAACAMREFMPRFPYQLIDKMLKFLTIPFKDMNSMRIITKNAKSVHYFPIQNKLIVCCAHPVANISCFDPFHPLLQCVSSISPDTQPVGVYKNHLLLLSRRALVAFNIDTNALHMLLRGPFAVSKAIVSFDQVTLFRGSDIITSVYLRERNSILHADIAFSGKSDIVQVDNYLTFDDNSTLVTADSKRYTTLDLNLSNIHFFEKGNGIKHILSDSGIITCMVQYLEDQVLIAFGDGWLNCYNKKGRIFSFKIDTITAMLWLHDDCFVTAHRENLRIWTRAFTHSHTIPLPHPDAVTHMIRLDDQYFVTISQFGIVTLWE